MWHRVALQVNPYAYLGRRAPRSLFASERSYNEAIVTECAKLGIGLIGVTDHWNASSGVSLISLAEQAGIIALPGFEAVSSEGLHVLVLFEHGTHVSEVDAAIGACGGTPGCTSGQPGRAFAEIISCAVARGAMAIPAHINGPDGLLTGLASGSATITAWRNPDIHAVAVCPAVNLTELQDRVLANAETEYARQHPVAVLHADDICDPTRLGTIGGSCWIKMASPKLAGIRLAARTPSTRTSLTDPARANHPAIEAIAWEGGFLDGTGLRFSRSLTCLVGGRGTGKSTAIESLRFALDLAPIGASARRGHQQMTTAVLQPGTKITVAIHSGHDSYTIERSVSEPAVVRDAAGSVLASRPTDILGAVEIFSQHELAELAESGDYVAELLRRFTAPPGPLLGRDSARTALQRNREDILASSRELEDLDEKIADLPRHQEALARFEAEGLDARLAEQAEIDSQRRRIGAAKDHVDELAKIASPLRTLRIPDAAAAEDTESKDNALDERLKAALERLHKSFRGAVAAFDAATAAARADLDAVQRQWLDDTSQIRESFDAVLRSLQDTGHDASLYLTTRRAVEQLRPLSERRPQVASRLAELRRDRLQLLAQLTDEAANDRRRVAEACSSAGEALKGVVRVRPVPSNSREDILRIVESIPGHRTQIRRAVEAQDFSPRALADAARRGSEALAREFDIRGAQATALAGVSEAVLMELEEMIVPTAAAASLNIAEGRGTDFRRLDELSQGQKATALLLLLLATSRGPLIIDQPEDDLDNRFIWEGVVPRLRELKNSRQLIFSTHNANIPVLGDAELVVVLESAERRGRVAADGAGSLDEESVRTLAEQILEGGREAFGRRRYLYGF